MVVEHAAVSITMVRYGYRSTNQYTESFKNCASSKSTAVHFPTYTQ